ncbi:hypothetical protein D3C74_397890 [compost metagenome]
MQRAGQAPLSGPTLLYLATAGLPALLASHEPRRPLQRRNAAGANAEHGGAELQLNALQKRVQPLLRMHRRFEQRPAEPGQVRAKRQRFGGVHAGVQAPAAN